MHIGRKTFYPCQDYEGAQKPKLSVLFASEKTTFVNTKLVVREFGMYNHEWHYLSVTQRSSME